MTRWVKDPMLETASCGVALIFTLLLGGAAQADLVQSTNAITGLSAWVLNDHSLRLELVQRYPSQTTAFFIARGFAENVATELAESGCVFQTIGKNTGATEDLSIRLSDWHIRMDGREHPLKLKKQWDEQWPQDAVSPTARIAFRWATFPTEQSFQPGDYNWGMTTFGLPPGTVFDLEVVWHEGDRTYSAILPRLQCAQDPP